MNNTNDAFTGLYNHAAMTLVPIGLFYTWTIASGPNPLLDVQETAYVMEVYFWYGADSQEPPT